MKTIKRLKKYKLILQCLLFCNVALVVMGGFAVAYFLRTHDLSSATIAGIGFLAFVIGVFAPIYLSHKITATINEMRVQTEERVIQWLNGWLENYESAGDDAIKEPRFWLNMILLSVEVLAQNTENSTARHIAEFGSVIRRELKKKQQTTKGRQKKAPAES
jgi:hypothetical protein